MKVVILAGGLGTRMSELTNSMPKPMVDVSGRPMLWHIMSKFSFHGFNDFIICLGYKGHIIREYFLNFYYNNCENIKIDFENNNVSATNFKHENWKVQLVDTGAETMTGGRLKRISKYLKNEEDFFFTYGDGVTNQNLNELVSFHKLHGKMATITAVQNQGRFGTLEIDKTNLLTAFEEKKSGDGLWINGGYFILNKKCLRFIEGDNTSWELEPLQMLTSKGEIVAFKHTGFWYAMDSLRDLNYLNQLAKSGDVKWLKHSQ